MKKIIYQWLFLFIITLSTACNDWLDVSPKTDMKVNDLFQTEEGFRDALIGVYALMCSNNSYAKDLTYGYIDVLGQYYASPLKTTSNGYDHNFKNVAQYNYKEKGEEQRIANIWSNSYCAIANLNMAIEMIDKNKKIFTTPHLYEMYKGELFGLRAFLHFDLLRLFASSPKMNNGNGIHTAGIPYVDHYTNIAQPQLLVSEVINKIKADLLTAKSLLSGIENFQMKDVSNPMYQRELRMNYYAVTTMLARVCLYADQKSEALGYAQELIGEPEQGSPTHYKLTKQAATAKDPFFHTEIIFMLDVQKLKDLSESYFIETFTSSSKILTMTSGGKTSLFDEKGLSNDFRNYWFRVMSNGSDWTLAKYNDQKKIPMIKFSELYLIAAESAPINIGIYYLNVLRNHRGLESIVLPTDDNEKLLTMNQSILKEYQREFIGEGQLFYYYKRQMCRSIGLEAEIKVENPEAIYNLPIPTQEIDFGKIKK